MRMDIGVGQGAHASRVNRGTAEHDFSFPRLADMGIDHRARSAARMPDSDLSSREQEVLRHLVGSRSNKEIANLLGITEATVKCHVSTILMRLNVSDRTQAVVTALQRGLVHL